MNITHLHLHDQYSVLDGLSSIQRYAGQELKRGLMRGLDWWPQ